MISCKFCMVTVAGRLRALLAEITLCSTRLRTTAETADDRPLIEHGTYKRKRSACRGVMSPGEIVKVVMAVLRARIPRRGL